MNTSIFLSRFETSLKRYLVLFILCCFVFPSNAQEKNNVQLQVAPAAARFYLVAQLLQPSNNKKN